MGKVSDIPIRWLFVLILLGGAILPMGVVGFWLTRTAARSGEELLRGRLEASLLQTAQDVGTRWIEIRSGLLDAGEHPSVVAILRDSAIDRGGGVTNDLRRQLARSAERVTRISIHRLDGLEVLRLYPDTEDGVVPEPWVFVELDLYEPPAGERYGTLRARVRWSALTRGQPLQAQAAEALLGVQSHLDGREIVPSPLDPDLMRRARFEVGDEPWVGASRRLTEPPLELLMAAPLGPFQQPFLQATRRGTLALLVFALGSSVGDAPHDPRHRLVGAVSRRR
jgi:hypothetical protein